MTNTNKNQSGVVSGSFLSRDELLDTDDRVIVELTIPSHVPVWAGRTLYIRTMTGEERDEFEKAMIVEGAEGQKVDTRFFRARVFAATVCTPQGDLIFNINDAQAISKKNSALLAFVFNKSAPLSGITREDEDELVKKSEAAVSEDSQTG